MPRAPSFLSILSDKLLPFATDLAACLDVGRFIPGSAKCERISRFRFTAIPVNSGFPDYYESCVTLPAHRGFRSSPFRLTETLAFRVVGCDFRHLAAVLRLPDFRVSHICITAKRKYRKSCALHLFSHMGSGSPALAIETGSLAFILIHEFSFLGSVALKSFRLTRALVPYGTAACYTPRPVSLSDKPQNDRLRSTRRASFSRSLMDCVDTFTYRLLKAVFQ